MKVIIPLFAFEGDGKGPEISTSFQLTIWPRRRCLFFGFQFLTGRQYSSKKWLYLRILEMIWLRRSLLAAAALAGLARIAPASALTINVDNVQLLYSESLNLNGFVDGSSYNADNQLAGQIVLTVNNVGNATQYLMPVFCVDIFHDIYLGSGGFEFSEGVLSTDNSAGTADAPAPLTATQITEILDLAT
jgi:hypothetical protein